MAVLQAARAYALGLPLETCYSWGLNRAIYIAAAKRGFKSTGRGGAGGGTSKLEELYSLDDGDDSAYCVEKGGTMLFTIGGEIQTKEAFAKQVSSRFGAAFNDAWKEALEYVKTFDKDTLRSRDAFFADVYRPRRDELAEKWTLDS